MPSVDQQPGVSDAVGETASALGSFQRDARAGHQDRVRGQRAIAPDNGLVFPE